MRTCSVFSCDNPVFGTDKRTGKGFCRFHQFLRVDKPPKKRKPLKSSRIPVRSDKRAKEEEEYRRVCDKIDKELQEAGKFRCWFTDKPLSVDRKVSHHHVFGRDGDLLTEKKWIKPCLNEPHLDYHNLPIKKLSCIQNS